MECEYCKNEDDLPVKYYFKQAGSVTHGLIPVAACEECLKKKFNEDKLFVMPSGFMVINHEFEDIPVVIPEKQLFELNQAHKDLSSILAYCANRQHHTVFSYHQSRVTEYLDEEFAHLKTRIANLAIDLSTIGVQPGHNLNVSHVHCPACATKMLKMSTETMQNAVAVEGRIIEPVDNAYSFVCMHCERVFVYGEVYRRGEGEPDGIPF